MKQKFFNFIQPVIQFAKSIFQKLPQIHLRQFRYGIFFLVGIVVGILFWFVLISQAPRNFKKDTIITIYSGMTTRDLSSLLEHQGIIRSSEWFHILMRTLLRGEKVIAGDYIFQEKQSVFSIARRITQGDYGDSQIKITFPEGITRHEITDILSQSIPEFARDEFLQKTYSLEGVIFPDTYYFFRTQSVDEILTSIQKHWNNKKLLLQNYFVSEEVPQLTTLTKQKFGGKQRTLQEIIIMASILEREANNAEESRVVAGILWKRIEKNMPMQVDATFKYTIGKTSSELTRAELQTDNPYNTYTRTGLPIGPIGNPGMAMILSTLEPEYSDYWYYLHDPQGKIYYAKNHDQHVQNKKKYLK